MQLPDFLAQNKWCPGNQMYTCRATLTAKPPADFASPTNNYFACSRYPLARPGIADRSDSSDVRHRKPVAIPPSVAAWRAPARAGNQGRRPGFRALATTLPLLPNGLSRKLSARHLGAQHLADFAGQTSANRARAQEKEISVERGGHREEHPISRSFPFSLEFLPLHAQQFPARRIVYENRLALPIHAGYHHVMKRRLRAAQLDANDQRPALFQVLPQIAPLPADGKFTKAGSAKILFHVGGEYTPCLSRIELFLNRGGILAGPDGRAVRAPILQKHSDGRGAAAVFRLFDIGNVEPNARAFRRRCLAEQRRKKAQQEARKDEEHRFFSMRANMCPSVQHCYQRDHQNRDDNDNQEVAVGQASRPSAGEIVLCLSGACRQLRQVFIAQL